MFRFLVRSEIRRSIVTDESHNREVSLEQDSGLTRLKVGHRVRIKQSDSNSPRRG